MLRKKKQIIQKNMFFSLFLSQFLTPSGAIGPFWDQNGTISFFWWGRWFWTIFWVDGGHFGVTLGSFLHRFGITLGVVLCRFDPRVRHLSRQLNAKRARQCVRVGILFFSSFFIFSTMQKTGCQTPGNRPIVPFFHARRPVSETK